MLTLATQYYYRGPHLIVLPGLAISVTILSLYLIGDGLGGTRSTPDCAG